MIPNISSASLKVNEFNQLPQFYVPADTYYDGTVMADSKCGGLYNKIKGNYVRFANIKVRLSQLAAPTQDRFAKVVAEMDALGGGRLIIDSSLNLTDDITLLASTDITIEKTGAINIAEGKIITLNKTTNIVSNGGLMGGSGTLYGNSSKITGNRQIFDTNLQFAGNFDVEATLPEWWGINDNITQDYTTVFENVKQFNLLTNQKVISLSKKYPIKNLHPGSGHNWIGIDKYSTGFNVLEDTSDSTPVSYGFKNVILARNSYYFRNWKPTNDISGGATSVTLTTPDSSYSLTVGEIIIISSTTKLDTSSGTSYDWQPTFVLLNKVLAYDSSTGVITLEKPIYDNIVGVQIAKINDFAISFYREDTPVISDCTFKNICFDHTGRSTINNHAFSFYISGMYNCIIDDIVMIGSSGGFSNNGICYSDINNIYALNSKGINRVAELKTGCYQVNVRNIYSQSSATASLTAPLVDCGEYAHRIYFENINIDMPNTAVTSGYVVGFSTTSGDDYIFKKFKLNLDHVDAGIQTSVTNTTKPSYSNIQFEDFEFICKNSSNNMISASGSGQSGYPCTFIIKNIRSASTFSRNAILIGYLDTCADCLISGIKCSSYIGYASNVVSTADSYSTIGIRFENLELIGLADCNIGLFPTASHSINPDSYIQLYQFDIANFYRHNEANIYKKTYRNYNASKQIYAAGDTIIFDRLFPGYTDFAWGAGDYIDIVIRGYFLGIPITTSVASDGTVTTSGIDKSITLTEVTSGTTIAKITQAASGQMFDIKCRISMLYNYAAVSSISKTSGSSDVINNTWLGGGSYSGIIEPKLIATLSDVGDASQQYIRLTEYSVIPKLAYK